MKTQSTAKEHKERIRMIYNLELSKNENKGMKVGSMIFFKKLNISKESYLAQPLCPLLSPWLFSKDVSIS